MNNLNEYFDKEITLSGFVEKVRNLQWVQFIVLRNKTDRLQITIEKSEESNKNLIEIVNNLTCESTIKVTGILKKNEKVKMGGMELIPSKIEVTSRSYAELPISITDKAAALIDTRMDNSFIDLRNDVNFNIFRIQSEFVRAMRQYLYDNGFTEIHTPKIIGHQNLEVMYLNLIILIQKRILHSLLSFINKWLWLLALEKYLK